MPRGLSIRLYAPDGRRFQYPEPGIWVLGKLSWDSEWDYDYLDPITPDGESAIRFCPWCGRDLREEKR